MASTRVLQADFTEGVLTTPNYVPNSTFELNGTDGWTLYNDGAVAAPIDGVGGTAAGLTMTAVASTIRGNFVGRLTKDAANRIGNGVAINLKPLAPVDLTKPVSISVEFNAGTNFVAGDVVAYVYDITGAALISGLQLSISNGRGVLQGFFIPSTASANYRLIFHIATVNALGWTLDLDSVLVGPQARGTSAAITDWQSYVPTFVGLGTVSIADAKWRRVGDTVEIEVRATSGTSIAVTAEVSLPSGLVIDSSKIVTTRSVGSYTRQLSSPTAGAMLGSPSAGYLNFSVSTAGLSAAVGNGFVGSSEPFAFFAHVPVVGWSSNTFSANNALTQYASNTDVTNANATTSGFYNGSDGALFGSYSGATRTKRVRFATPYNVNERLFLETTENGNKFIELASSAFLSTSPTTGMGYTRVAGSDTDFDVQFGSAGYAANLISGGAAGWSGVASNANYRWRLVKISAGGDVLLPISAANITGQTTAPAAGFIGEQRPPATLGSALGVGASGAWQNVISITLPAGVWFITGALRLVVGTGTGFIRVASNLSLNSGSPDADVGSNSCDLVVSNNIQSSPTSFRTIVVPAGTSTIMYLLGLTSYSTVGTATFTTATQITATRIA